MTRSSNARLPFVAALALLACPAGLARGQAADRDWWYADRPVRAMVSIGDTLYIGGDFLSVGPPRAAPRCWIP